jgi:hypothetical protein
MKVRSFGIEWMNRAPDSLRHSRRPPEPATRLAAFQVSIDPIQIIAVLGGIGFPGSVDLA